MEQEAKTANAAKEHQEVGVCGTGKHRVISVLPFPLTPSSASTIPPGSIKRRGNKRRRGRHSNPSYFHSRKPANISNVDFMSKPAATADSRSTAESQPSEYSMPGKRPEVSPGSENLTLVNDSAGGSHVDQPKNNAKSGSQSGISPITKANRPSLLGKRERVIEISPSLRLPVTAVPSSKATQRNFHGGLFSENTVDGAALTNVPSVSSSRTSLSDMTSLGLSISEDVEDVSTFSEQDSDHPVSGGSFIDLQSECERLKHALKLADADIAILVSSKQQLQLDFHNEEEKVKVLSRLVLDVQDKNHNFENFIEQLKSSIQEQKERSNSDLERYQSETLTAKSKIDDLQNSLDVTLAERDSKQLQITHLKHNLARTETKLERSEAELKELTKKTIQLESLMEETVARGEGKESFISLLTQDKNEVMQKLQESVNSHSMLQIANKTLEAKIADLQHANESLVNKAEKYEALFRETDAKNMTLSSRLQAVTREKMDLNSAVGRLRSDMAKVENSFSRLRQQLIEKTQLAEQESIRKSDLAEKVRSLSTQMAKLDNVDAETRIRDKNVQIEQLLTLSKVSNTEKAKLEKQVEKLGKHIASNEKSWITAIEREKQTSLLLQEKENLIAQKSSEIENLSTALEKERQRTEKMADASKLDADTLSQLRLKLKGSEEMIEMISGEKTSMSEVIDGLRRELRKEKEKGEAREAMHVDEGERLQQKIQKLNNEVDSLQKDVVSKDDELQLLTREAEKSNETTKFQNEDHSIRQLELLSELQSARRELSQQKDALILENNKLNANIDILKQEIQEYEITLQKQKRTSEEELEKVRAAANVEKVDLQSEVTALQEKWKMVQKSKLQTEEEMAVVKDHNNVLSGHLGALQIHDGQLTKELEKKIQENEEILEENELAKKELEVLKQDLANVTQQLTDSLHNKGKQDKEKDLLRNAVIRQQQYCISLQKHYEKWAKEAEVEMRAELARYKNNLRDLHAQRRETHYYSSPMTQPRQTSHTASHGYNNDGMLGDDENDIHLREKLLSHPTNEKELEDALGNIPLFGSSAAEQKQNGFNIHNQMESDSVKSFKCKETKETLLEKIDAFTQTEHDCEYVGTRQGVFGNPDTAALVEEKLSLMEENTQQAEHIAELEERIQNWSMSDSPAIADSSTQTLHDEDLLPLPTDSSAKSSPLLEDSWSQTEHDNELVGHKSAARLEDELLRLKEFSDRRISELQQRNAELNGLVCDLNKRLDELKDSRACMLEDSGTQTDHDEVPVAAMRLPHARHEVASTLLEDSSTQTVPENNFIPPGTHIVDSEEKLELAREEIKKLSSELRDETMKNSRLLTAITEHKEVVKRSMQNVSVQTLSEDKTVDPSETVEGVHDIVMIDASCQSDHDEQPLSSARSQTSGNAFTSVESMSDVSSSQIPDFPSPMLILRTMESKKLKAYKKTVHLMKKKLESAEEKIANLQAELRVSPEAIVSNPRGESEEESLVETDVLKAVQEELHQVKKTMLVQAEEAKRKALAERKISESKLSVLSDRLSSVTDANEHLRNSVQVLQVKLTEKSRQCGVALKEKTRYQMRARRLQASLRSLAWITGSQEKNLGLPEDVLDDSVGDVSVISEDPSENSAIGARGDGPALGLPTSVNSALSLPASVVEIEASLKDLQSEIVALEKQMQEHNTAVKHSKTQWNRLKEESRVLATAKPVVNPFEQTLKVV